MLFTQCRDHFSIVGIIRVAAGPADEWVRGGAGPAEGAAVGLIRNTVFNLLV